MTDGEKPAALDSAEATAAVLKIADDYEVRDQGDVGESYDATSAVL